MCGAFYWASFHILDMGFESMGAWVWPRAILVVLTAFSLLYLVQSLRRPPVAGEQGTPVTVVGSGGLKGWVTAYRNPIWCFLAYGVFLVTLPYLGMLIGGVLFVFGVLILLGERGFKSLLIHGAIALVTVGAMWAVFTFGLRVILPEGEIFTVL